MRVVTYNLRHGGSKRNHWQSIFAEFDPELFLVQETYAPREHLPPLLTDVDESHWVWSQATLKGVARKWGSAVYSKSHDSTAIDVPEKLRGWIVGSYFDPIKGDPYFSNPLHVFSVHAPSGMGSYQSIVNEILDEIGRLANGGDVLIAGDFNLTVGVNIPSTERPTRPGDLRIQQRLREEFNLINCWQEANPGKPLAQTLRWSNKPEIPYHCDGIFVPNHWAENLVSCEVLSGEPWIELSDHNPIVAEFRT